MQNATRPRVVFYFALHFATKYKSCRMNEVFTPSAENLEESATVDSKGAKT